MLLRVLLPLLLACALVASPAGLHAEEHWYAVYLDQQHIGHFQLRREQRDQVVETHTRIRLRLLRNGEAMTVESRETAIEDTNGRPIGFSSDFTAGDTRSSVLGRVDALGNVEAVVDQAGRREMRRMPWPGQALLAEGQRRALLALGERAGARSRVLSFDPVSMQALPLRSEVVGAVTLDLAEGQEHTLHLRQWLGEDREGKGGARSELWIRPQDALPRRMRLPALGLQLDLRACSQDCALAPPQSADVLQRSLAASPRPLGVRERGAALDYRLQVDEGSLAALGEVPGQVLLEDAEGTGRLWLDPEGDRRSPPDDEDLRPTRWLQSDHEGVRALAAEAVGGQRSQLRRMQRMEQRVREHIRLKSLRVGYASAAETLQQREGDCTEHAVLLAAMARAQGIPARVVTGLAYAPRFGQRLDVFVPHAWVIAWVEGRWQGFDAALPRFDAGHLGFSAGDGDPFDFYAGMELLGKLRIVTIEPVGRRELAARRRSLPRES